MLKQVSLLQPLILAVSALAQGTSPKEAWLLTDNYGDPTALMTALKSQLKRHPQGRRFHIMWGMAEPHGGNSGTLIYDRQRAILWIHQSQSGNWPVDENEVVFKVSYSTQQWKFRRVTPNRLKLLFRKYSRVNRNTRFSDISYEVSLFPRLTEFGARGGLVGRTSKSWREKWVDGRRIRVR
jgi:hypothetical protein